MSLHMKILKIALSMFTVILPCLASTAIIDEKETEVTRRLIVSGKETKGTGRRLIVSKDEVIFHRDGRVQLPSGAIGYDASWSPPLRLPNPNVWVDVAKYFNEGHFLATGNPNGWGGLTPAEQMFYYGLYKMGLFKRFMLGEDLPKEQIAIGGWIEEIRLNRDGDLHSVVDSLNSFLKTSQGGSKSGGNGQ